MINYEASIASELIKRAKADGMSFIDIASATGVSLPTVYGVWNGKSNNRKVIDYLITHYSEIDQKWVVNLISNVITKISVDTGYQE